MPDLSSIPTGFNTSFADAEEFVRAVRFARPGWLVLAVIPVVLAVVRFAVAGQRRTSALPAEAVARLRTGPRGRGRLARFCLAVAWSVLVVGAAGPGWGVGDDGGVAVGRDVVVVIDVSRSMLAEDMAGPPARWQVAVAAVEELLASLRSRGGHRVALVIFAGRAKVLVPLTTDYDHLRAKLQEIDGAHLPPEVRPLEDAKSGTRIGSGIALALAVHDPRFPGSQDILLLSDGDDPVKDRDWADAVKTARTSNIPIHAIGLGDPVRPSPVFIDGRLLEFPRSNGVPDPVQTKLDEEVMASIASEGRGHYLPAHREVPKLGEFFRTKIEPFRSRELTDDALPQPRDRSVWFLGFGLILLTAAWILRR